MERAYLTHSFHCCAFKFPQRHNPTKHKEYLDLVKRFKNECKNEQFTTTGSPPTASVLGSSEKKRRSISENHENSKSSTSLPKEFGFLDEFDFEKEFEDGTFHPFPVQLNHTIIAACGNLSFM